MLGVELGQLLIKGLPAVWQLADVVSVPAAQPQQLALPGWKMYRYRPKQPVTCAWLALQVEKRCRYRPQQSVTYA